jgi:hypothetical protein
VPWHSLTPSGHQIDCGRRPGYLQQRLHELRTIAEFARTHQRRITWG